MPSAEDRLRRRIERDPDAVLARIAETTSVPLTTVRAVVRAIRTVVDDLLGDGHIVVFEHMVLSFGDSPTRHALRERLRSAEVAPDDVLPLDHYAIAAWLGLDFDTYADRPLATRPLVGKEVFDLMGPDAPPRPMVWDVLEAWDESFADGRSYKVSSAGREAALEWWLADHLDRLANFGLAVELAHRQLILPNKKKPDLVCRIVKDAPGVREGDWLVVELKATRFYPAAADQIEGYMEQVDEHLAAGDEAVHGLLITDGADHSEIADLTGRGIAHLSLSAVGYRLAIAQEHPTPSAAAWLSSRPESVADAAPSARTLEEDGPHAYLTLSGPAHLLDRHNGVDRREIAEALWWKREERRRRYVREWGSKSQWPAEHPTTVVHLTAPVTLDVAVCVRCNWLALHDDEGGSTIDLQSEAKAHALRYPHDPRLDIGENPPRPLKPGGLAAQGDEARNNARRAARRVALREFDT